MNKPPIAIFVYKRPEHTKHMLNSLCKNTGYEEAEITVYCDGPKNEKELADVAATRKVVQEILPEAIMVERNENFGLAKSIINGVSEQCEKHGHVIVLEDDLILSPVAIDYLNQALSRYQEYEKVMHISAYMFPVKLELPSAFFYREASCWGWATWERAWKHFETNPDVILHHIKVNRLGYEFNIKNSMYFLSMLRRQSKGQLDSWAIRWYGSMFMHGGLSLHPAKSLVRNNGFDGSGIHCNKTDVFDVTLSQELPAFPDEIIESKEAIKAMVDYRQKISNKPGLYRSLERLAANFFNKLYLLNK